jgi:hypothetical protein
MMLWAKGGMGGSDREIYCHDDTRRRRRRRRRRQ